MTEVPAAYFDGRTSQPRAITLRFDPVGGTVELIGENLALRYPRAGVTIDSPLGRTNRFLRLPDGGRCEVTDLAALDRALATWKPARGAAWLHRVERSGPLVLVAVVVLVVFSWLLIRHGLPWGARQVAFALPERLTRELGHETLDIFDKGLFEPSALEPKRRAGLQQAFQEFLGKAGDRTTYRLEFRKAPAFGANAFALPSGDIVITDDLVALAGNDREILGVLAHECGHVQQRHALRGVLQNSAIFVVIALITGDVSHATAFGGAIPAFLMQNKFSREFEQEADAHAVRMLKAAGLDPVCLADILEKLAAKTPGPKGKVFDYLSSHPPTPERIQSIKGSR